MTSFTFNNQIPAAANNPSVDQPQMLLNNVSNFDIWEVDHVGFNSVGSGGPNSSSGQHLQVTFNDKFPPAVAPTDPLSILYTDNITVATATNTVSASPISQVFFRNQNAIQPVTLIKAYGFFDSAGTSLNSFNISSSAFSGVTGYTLTIPPNVLTGNNYGILAMSNTPVPPFPLVGSSSIISATSCNVAFRSPTTAGTTVLATSFTVIILQL